MCCVLQSSCGKPSFGVIIRNRSKVVVDTLFSPRAFCWGKYKIFIGDFPFKKRLLAEAKQNAQTLNTLLVKLG